MRKLKKILNWFFPAVISRYFYMRIFIKSQYNGEKYDLIQAMDVSSIDGAIFLKSQCDAPIILDINELPNLRYRGAAIKKSSKVQYLNDYNKRAVKKIDFYMSTCDSLAEYSNTFFSIKDTISIKNANSLWVVDAIKHQSRTKKDVKKITIAFPATCAPNYGAEQTVRALSELPKSVHLVFIGRFKNQEYEEKILGLVNKLNLSKRVSYKGPFYGEEYLTELAQCDIGISPLALNVQSHNHILPSRILDIISAELFVISTNIQEFKKLNELYNIGIGIDKLGVKSIVEAVNNYLALENTEVSYIISNVRALKNELTKEREQTKYFNLVQQVKDLKLSKVAFVCNSGIINNQRLAVFCETLEKNDIAVDVFCIEAPKKAITRNLQDTKFFEYEKYFNRYETNVVLSSTKLSLLGFFSLVSRLISQFITSQLNNFTSSKVYKRIFPVILLKFLFMERFIKRKCSTQEYDFVQSMDVLSLHSAVDLKNTCNVPLILDVNELPSLRGRGPSVYRSPKTQYIIKSTKTDINNVDLCLSTCQSLANYNNKYFSIDNTDTVMNANPLYPVDLVKGDGYIKERKSTLMIAFPSECAPCHGAEQIMHALLELPDYVCLKFVGNFKSSSYQGEIINLAAELRLSDRIFLTDPLYEREYVSELAQCDIAIPSLSLNVNSHNYILPSNVLDVISAEVFIIYVNIPEFKQLNKTYNIGIGINEFTTASIVKAVNNYLVLDSQKVRQTVCNVRKLKKLLTQEIEQNKYFDLVEGLVNKKIKKAAFVCSSSIEYNKRLRNYLLTLEGKGVAVDVYCIEAPMSDLFSGLKSTQFIEYANDFNRFDFSLLLSSVRFSVLGFLLKKYQDYMITAKTELSIIYKKSISRSKRISKDQLTSSINFSKRIDDVNFKPDIILLHDTLASKAGLTMSKNHPTAKLVLDVTEIPDLRERAGINLRNLTDATHQQFRDWEMNFVSKTDLIYTLNNGFQKFVSERYNKKTKIVKNIRPYIEPKPIHLRAMLNLSPDDIVVVSAGISSPMTGAMQSIVAISRCEKNVNLLFLGGFVNKAFGKKLADKAKKLNITDRVHFHEPIYSDDYINYLAACDVGLVVFNTDYLQTKLVLPNRFLDFVSANLPMISTKLTDVEEYLLNHDIGTVIDEITGKVLADAIQLTLSKYSITKNKFIDKGFTDRISKLSLELSNGDDFNLFGKEVCQLAQSKGIKKPKIAFLARQRLHSNTRITRQCKALCDAGADVHLFGINEGPSDLLLEQAGNTEVTIFKV